MVFVFLISLWNLCLLCSFLPSWFINMTEWISTYSLINLFNHSNQDESLRKSLSFIQLPFISQLHEDTPIQSHLSRQLRCRQNMHSTQSIQRLLPRTEFHYWVCFSEDPEGDQWLKDKSLHLGHCWVSPSPLSSSSHVVRKGISRSSRCITGEHIQLW